MELLIKLTDAIWLLQLVISSPLIYALGNPSQAPPPPHWDLNPGPQIYIQLSYPSP